MVKSQWWGAEIRLTIFQVIKVVICPGKSVVFGLVSANIPRFSPIFTLSQATTHPRVACKFLTTNMLRQFVTLLSRLDFLAS